jgi:hypothetical protein
MFRNVLAYKFPLATPDLREALWDGKIWDTFGINSLDLYGDVVAGWDGTLKLLDATSRSPNWIGVTLADLFGVEASKVAEDLRGDSAEVVIAFLFDAWRTA